MFIRKHEGSWEWNTGRWGEFQIARLSNGLYMTYWWNDNRLAYRIDGETCVQMCNILSSNLSLDRDSGAVRKFSTVRQRCRRFLRKLQRENPG